MDNLNLSTDESILFKTRRIIISGVQHEAILTVRRLILVKGDDESSRTEIPLADIKEVTGGMNNVREPTITLQYQTLDTGVQTVELVFIYQTGGLHVQERDRFITALKNQGVSAHADEKAGKSSLISSGTKPHELVVEQAPANLQAPDLIISSIPRAKKVPDEEPKPRSAIQTVIALVIIFGIVIGAIFLSGQVFNAKKPVSQVDLQVTPVMTAIPPAPVPTPTMTPLPTEVPPEGTTPSPTVGIPPAGIWVKVEYPGSFSGSISAQGRTIDVKGSDETKYYQLSLVDPVFDGTIEKLDGSSGKLVASIYKDGVLIGRRTTTSPFGQVDLHMTGPETVVEETPTPIPTPVTTVIYEYLPQITIPSTGTWFRVYYAGEYQGSAGGNGIFTPISGTGDQMVKIPENLALTTVDGTFEKLDGSSGWMVVEVYNNGTRISRTETTKPYGTIDVHVPLQGQNP